jgi:hypothetical protein
MHTAARWPDRGGPTAVRRSASSHLTLSPGTRVGPYEALGPISTTPKLAAIYGVLQAIGAPSRLVALSL